MHGKIEDVVEVERNGVLYRIKRGKVEWRSPTVKELASVITLYDYFDKSAKDLLEILGFKFKLKNPRRDWKKFKHFLRIAGSLPCTVFVLSKRVGTSRVNAYSYLNELMDWGMVEKKLDDECELFKYYLKHEYMDSAKLAEAILKRLRVKVKRFRRGKKYEEFGKKRGKLRVMSDEEFELLKEWQDLVFDEKEGKWIPKWKEEIFKKSLEEG